MAKNIKGITIEIDGNTTKLNDALKTTNKAIYSTNSELRQLNSALKLDPKNTELLSQKQELLKNNINATKDKLNQLKEAQKQMGNYNKLTDDQKESYRTLTVEIAKSESAIKNMNKELKNTGSIDLSAVGTTLKKVGDIASEVVKKVAQVVAGVSAAMAGVVTAGVKSYADLEQNIGGVETLFGDSAQKVIDNANKAYETAGVSANEYMQGVTSFSASLLQSLGGDTSKAADVADMAFQDMSDNANKFGTDMGSIQNAYQGFAKQNYTMLDNLKLGYGGTKTEMERLLKDAQKISGVKYDINNLSDVYNAIHVIQGELGVTGTTAKEAATTISGSATSMKAAFDNFLNGSGSPEQLGQTINNFLKNVSNAITQLAPQILTGLTTVIETVAPQIGTLLNTLLPQLLEAAQNLLTSLCTMISQNVQPIADLVVNLLTMLVTFIVQNLPMIIQVGLQLLVALATGIAENLPTLIPTIIEAVLTIVNALIDNLPLIISAGLDLIMALVDGLIAALPTLIEAVPRIIMSITTALLQPEMLAKLIECAIRLIIALGAGLISAIPQLLTMTPQIILSLLNSFKDIIKNTDWGKLGKNILKGILEGLTKAKDVIKQALKKVKDSIVDGLKSLFGIHSPSTVMRDLIGVNLSKGVGVGFEKGMPETLKKVKGAMGSLTSSVKGSVINTDLGTNGHVTSANTSLPTQEKGSFNVTINNNSKYTTPADNVRLLRQQHEMYQLKYGR